MSSLHLSDDLECDLVCAMRASSEFGDPFHADMLVPIPVPSPVKKLVQKIEPKPLSKPAISKPSSPPQWTIQTPRDIKYCVNLCPAGQHAPIGIAGGTGLQAPGMLDLFVPLPFSNSSSDTEDSSPCDLRSLLKANDMQDRERSWDQSVPPSLPTAYWPLPADLAASKSTRCSRRPIHMRWSGVRTIFCERVDGCSASVDMARVFPASPSLLPPSLDTNADCTPTAGCASTGGCPAAFPTRPQNGGESIVLGDPRDWDKCGAVLAALLLDSLRALRVLAILVHCVIHSTPRCSISDDKFFDALPLRIFWAAICFNATNSQLMPVTSAGRTNVTLWLHPNTQLEPRRRPPSSALLTSHNRARPRGLLEDLRDFLKETPLNPFLPSGALSSSKKGLLTRARWDMFKGPSYFLVRSLRASKTWAPARDNVSVALVLTRFIDELQGSASALTLSTLAHSDEVP
ncbi:hypothetical protein C8J57DRAFT_1229581 [Mycena rebaudengoi]|nr:hypothetical protein C8J57DRAFT_1229581 [Mycena rebaudengoi]